MIFQFWPFIGVSPKYTYMVRAVTLQTTPSGSYFNPSQGIFASIIMVPPPTIQARAVPNVVLLSWNSLPGASYHVEAKELLTQGNWLNLSGTIIATDTVCAWTDTGLNSLPHRMYRIICP